MKITSGSAPSIHIELKKLIEEKSKRDQIKFTNSQLASALNMPRSIITKLIHPDHSKRVLNPRIDTLLKIVDFFRTDGFNITVEKLLGVKTKSIDVQNQKISLEKNIRTIPLFSFNSKLHSLGSLNIKISTVSKNIIALLADEDMKPLFKKGSIFVVDPDMDKKNDRLVAIKLNDFEKIQIRKYTIEGHKKILRSFEPTEKPIVLMPSTFYEIIGVIIQVNAKT